MILSKPILLMSSEHCDESQTWFLALSYLVIHFCFFFFHFANFLPLLSSVQNTTSELGNEARLGAVQFPKKHVKKEEEERIKKNDISFVSVKKKSFKNTSFLKQKQRNKSFRVCHLFMLNTVVEPPAILVRMATNKDCVKSCLFEEKFLTRDSQSHTELVNMFRKLLVGRPIIIQAIRELHKGERDDSAVLLSCPPSSLFSRSPTCTRGSEILKSRDQAVIQACELKEVNAEVPF